MKLVGFIFDSKLTWEPMVDYLAKKARIRLGAICRLRHHLDSDNLKTMYTAFVRSVIEYGSVLYVAAGSSYLNRFDKIQIAAEKMGGFTVESLASSTASHPFSSEAPLQPRPPYSIKSSLYIERDKNVFVSSF